MAGDANPLRAFFYPTEELKPKTAPTETLLLKELKREDSMIPPN